MLHDVERVADVGSSSQSAQVRATGTSLAPSAEITRYSLSAARAKGKSVPGSFLGMP